MEDCTSPCLKSNNQTATHDKREPRRAADQRHPNCSHVYGPQSYFNSHN